LDRIAGPEIAFRLVGEEAMYVSRLTFHTIPGKTGEAETALRKLQEMVASAGGGAKPRILHTHFASLGAPDIVFEQEVEDLASFEAQLRKLTDNKAFQSWTKKMSPLLRESPKRELYLLAE
jgi:hypothetical protein